MIGWLIGQLWWWFLPIRKQESISRFQKCFPNKPPSELRRGVGIFCTQYLRLVFGRRLRLPTLPQGAAIILAGHGGAWDMALLSVAEKRPISIFVKRPSNRLLAWLIARWRHKAGIESLYGRGVLMKGIAALDEKRWLVFVQDQRLNDGIDVAFFKRPAKTAIGFAAAVLKRPKVPIYGIWQSDHAIEIEKIDLDIPNSSKEAIHYLTQASQNFYEEKIKQSPGTWLWLHRRWKH